MVHFNGLCDFILVFGAFSMKRSSFCYPTLKEVNTYISYVEHFQSKPLRILVKTMLLTGIRFAEAINGWYFYDAEGVLFFQCVSAKRRKILIAREGQSRYLGKKILENYLTQPIWKKIKCVNLFKMDISEIEEIAETPMQPLGEVTGFSNYLSAYRSLKKELPNLKVKFRMNEDEELSTAIEIPAFHFFRKLYAAEYTRQFGMPAAVEKMKWKNLNVFFNYVKDYEVE